ncbi:MAG: MFS transporter, partial [Candidatus Dormiibacterota bacterium]
TTSAALVELSEERSGVGSAVLQAVNKTGAPFGTAILGSVLSTLYLSHLALRGLAPPLAAAVRRSVFGGVGVAQQLGSSALLRSVRVAFVSGMDEALLVSAGIAIVGLVLTLLFLPRSNRLQETLSVTPLEEREVAGVS